MTEREFSADCDLCEAARITEWFHEDEVCWIAECEICDTPMVVWRWHGIDPSPEALAHMHGELARVSTRGHGGSARAGRKAKVRERGEGEPDQRQRDDPVPGQHSSRRRVHGVLSWRCDDATKPEAARRRREARSALVRADDSASYLGRRQRPRS